MLDLNGSTILLTGANRILRQRVRRARHPLLARRGRTRVFARRAESSGRCRAKFGDEQVRYLIGDVRDRARMTRAVEGADIVVHAAAMKQVNCVRSTTRSRRYAPTCSARSTWSTPRSTRTHSRSSPSVPTKAVNPVNLYGATKLCAEKIFVQGNAYAAQHQTRLACVRYGNVVGSRGSVVPVFREQLARVWPPHDHRRSHDPVLDHAPPGGRSRALRAREHGRRRSFHPERSRRCASPTSPRRSHPARRVT